MRIALIAGFSVTGGTRTYFEMLARLLHQQGHSLVGLVPGWVPTNVRVNGFMEKYFEYWYACSERKGFTARRFPFSALWEWRHLVPLIVRHRPDMLFFSHGTPGDWLSALWMPLPIVHMLHTCVQPAGRIAAKVLPCCLRRLSERKVLGTGSHYAAARIKELWNADANVVYIPATYSPRSKPLDKKQNTKHVVSLGHVVDYKNPYVWLSVAQRVLLRHPDARFTWYGDGPLLANMRKLAQGIEGVRFAGPIEDASLCFADADIFFHPSALDNQPLAILEAMSFGLPCVSSNVGGISESVVHGVTGYTLDPDDGGGMADAICYFLESPDLRQQMGQAALEKVGNRFMKEAWANETLSLIQRVRGA